MPFEPFYHRDPNKPFAQYSPGQTLYIVVKGDGLTEAELTTAYREYVKWIDVPLAGIGLNFSWNLDPFQVPAGGTLVRVTFTQTGWHGAKMINPTTYDIVHNVMALMVNPYTPLFGTSNVVEYKHQTFVKKQLGAHVCLHEFLHILGVPHEIHNPLLHFCLKPNWEKILNWESVSDIKIKALKLEGKINEAEWLGLYAFTGLKDFYYCLRWTLFSDDIEMSYQFDPFHAAGGSTGLFHLYMDQIPGTEDIYTDKGIIIDEDRVMTSSLKTFLQTRFTNQKVTTRLNGRRKWFLNAQGIYDPKIFLPDEYLRRMTYKNPFMQQLIDDNFLCVEDLQWFKYETMHRYINLSGTDVETREKCARQFPYAGCDPFRSDNFLNVWNKQNQTFSICPVWADNLRKYCTSTTTQPTPFPTTPFSTPLPTTTPNYNGVLLNVTIEANYEELVGSPIKMAAVVAAVTKDIAFRLRISESQIQLLSVISGSVKMSVFVGGVEPNKAVELSAVKDITIPTANGTVTHKVSYLVTQSPIATQSRLKSSPPIAKKTNWVLIGGLIGVFLLLALVIWIAYARRKEPQRYGQIM